MNDGITKEFCSLSYMSVDEVAARIVQLGKGALMAKFDLKAAYRNVPVHPDDRWLLGMVWEDQLFVDRMYHEGHQAKAGKECGYPLKAQTTNMLRHLRRSWEKDRHNADDIMLWAACCTCFFGFLRSREITVPSMKSYDPGCHLSAGNVTVDSLTSPKVV